MYSNHQSAHSAAAKVQAAQQLSNASQTNLPRQGRESKGGKSNKKFSLLLLVCVLLPLPYLKACSLLPKTEAEAQSTPSGSGRREGKTPVDVAIARTGILQEALEYTGTTRPVREVSVRGQVEGRLLNLQVGVGDRVRQGQILAQLDDAMLVTELSEAQAELAALQSEVARAQTQVSNARTQAEQARVELQQAQADAARRQTLVRQGAISQQEAELAQTAARTAQQALQSAIAQIATEQQAVAAAQGRVAAQRAVVAQSQERRSYTLLTSPINGVVLEKVNEPGNLIQPGGELLKLGDFSQVKVVVPVSELKLSKIRVGQPVQVRLDAFADQEFSGRVTRISPAADVTALQLPIEITIPNSNGQVGSGLLARVSFEPKTTPRVVVPQTALQEGSRESGAKSRESGVRSQESGVRSQESGARSQESGARSQESGVGSRESGVGSQAQSQATVFVVIGEGAEAKVQARRVQVGDRVNGKAEILSGLQPEERFVVRSGKPLKDGEQVRLSVLSEK